MTQSETELLSRGVVALERIAIALEAFGGSPAVPEPAPAGCPHPEDQRIDMGPDEWVCRGCRYHHNAEPETIAS